jgi:hypothetical protein
MRAMLEKWGRLVLRLHADVTEDLRDRQIPNYLVDDIRGFIEDITDARAILESAIEAEREASAIREQASKNLTDNPGTDA